MLLARLGRPEVSNCVEGLKQYNYAYEEAGEEAIDMERAYASAVAGDSDITHMASVVQGTSEQQQQQNQSGSGQGRSLSPREQPMVVDSGPYPPPRSTNGSSSDVRGETHNAVSSLWSTQAGDGSADKNCR